MIKTINFLHSKIWAQLFIIYCRYLIGGTFAYSSIVKIKGERFTSVSGENSPINTPFHFFETLYQTGLYWKFIGWAQLIAAFFLMTQRFSKLGALIFFPLILNIFIITISINFNYTWQISGLMLLASVALILWDWNQLRLIINQNPLIESKSGFEYSKTWEVTGFILFLYTVAIRYFSVKYDIIVWFSGCVLIGFIGLFFGIKAKKVSSFSS